MNGTPFSLVMKRGLLANLCEVAPFEVTAGVPSQISAVPCLS